MHPGSLFRLPLTGQLSLLIMHYTTSHSVMCAPQNHIWTTKSKLEGSKCYI